ncbi:MAG: zinc transporter ZntB [Pseudomonadota bacterium]
MRGFILNGGTATETSFAEAAAQFGKAQFVWLHLDGRIDDAQAWLKSQDDIPEIARGALLASETRPRSDAIGHGALVNLRALGVIPEDDPDPLVSMRFWAETGRAISLSYRSPLALEPVIAEFLNGAITDGGDLVSEVAVEITEQLDPYIAAMGDTLDDIEVGIESERLRALRRKVNHVRSRAISYRRFVSPQRTALERLATEPCNWLDEDDRLHLRDAADRFARMAEELESIRERAAIVHDELTDLRAEQLDSRGLIIAIVAFVFLPLTFLTGLLGMNVEGIPYAKEPWAFWGVVAVCLMVGMGVIAYFVRRHWLER